METHVARDEQGRVLRWCSHCKSYQSVIHCPLYIISLMVEEGWYCLECGERIGTRPDTDGVKYE